MTTTPPLLLPAADSPRPALAVTILDADTASFRECTITVALKNNTCFTIKRISMMHMSTKCTYNRSGIRPQPPLVKATRVRNLLNPTPIGPFTSVIAYQHPRGYYFFFIRGQRASLSPHWIDDYLTCNVNDRFEI